MPETIDKCCNNCVKTPFSTLFAFILLLCGLSLLTGSLISVFERIKTNNLFDYNKNYEVINIIIATIVSVMVVIGVLFLITSIILSGNTRKTLFWGSTKHLCAKILNTKVFVLCYILMIVWFIITCILLFPLIINVYYKYIDCKDDCIDTKFLFLIKFKNDSTTTTTTLCGEHKFQLCDQFSQYLISFSISFTGSFLIMLSLIHFIIGISSNHAYIRSDNPIYEDRNQSNVNDNIITGPEETKM